MDLEQVLLNQALCLMLNVRNLRRHIACGTSRRYFCRTERRELRLLLCQGGHAVMKLR